MGSGLATPGAAAPLGHHELPSYSHEQLMAVFEAASSEIARVLIGLLGLIGLRSGEARSLLVGDLRDDHLSSKNGGATTDTTKTRVSRRLLPVPAILLPLLVARTTARRRT